jgi:hypothetical protein
MLNPCLTARQASQRERRLDIIKIILVTKNDPINLLSFGKG